MDIKIFAKVHKSATPTVTPPTSLADVGSETNADTELNLTWTKSVDGVMTNYRVYVGGILQQTFGDVALGTLTGLTQGATYSNITVRAWDGTTESADSNSINATTETLYGPELFDIEEAISLGTGVIRVGDTFECLNCATSTNVFTVLSACTLTVNYKVEFTVTDFVEGKVYQKRPVDDVAGGMVGNGDYSNIGEATQVNILLKTTTANTTCTISNISVKEVL